MDYLISIFAFVFVFLIGWALGVRTQELHEKGRPVWFHPPDDDDGISRLEDDPDGQYQR